MPELPEVETIKTILDDIVKNKTIKSIKILRDKNILNDPGFFVSSLVGQTFLNVSRIGKFLIFHLTSSLVIISHLRMEGKYFEGKVGDPVEKHDICIYEFTDGTTLRYNDVRKFGIIKLSKEDTYLNEPPIDNVGPEPFSITKEELYEGLKKKSGPIKEALLDQSLIAGLGNIYDDEVLFATKINPKMEANKVTLEQCQAIIDESIRILNIAIKNGGSTIKSYHPKEGVNGLMQNNLLAYGHGNEPCSRCSFPLRKIFIGGRGTVYCPRCQKEEGKPLIIGITGPIASGKSTISSYLKDKGYEVIDADKIVDSIYKNNDFGQDLQVFLGDIYENNQINRTKLLDKMIEDASFKKDFETRIHNRVFSIIKDKISKSKSDKIVLDVPLLVPSPIEELCDLIIMADAKEEVRKNRLIERGKDPEKAFKLNKTFQRGKTIAHSGLVIDTNGTKKELIAKLDSLNLF
ncbi:MAG: DNA-formamidopyrimidine glycosylase [Bacilli bacterium]|nr:DNA-formamidopyrimidine glycosylase [Bacilli bacterium]